MNIISAFPLVIQTYMTISFLQNTKEDILKKVGDRTALAPSTYIVWTQNQCK